MKKRWGVLLIVLLLGVMLVPAAFGTAGTTDDPLVTLSYLNDTFLNNVLRRVDEKLAQQPGSTAPGDDNTGSQGAAFQVVTLSSGQSLNGAIGCEVMLRVGSAQCISTSSPGLIDETTAGVLENNGALVQNHLYMMTIENRSVKATAATTKLLVRGNYTIT